MLDLASYPALEALNAHLTRDEGRWPLKCEEPILTKLNTWAALRESDKPVITRTASGDMLRAARPATDAAPPAPVRRAVPVLSHVREAPPGQVDGTGQPWPSGR